MKVEISVEVDIEEMLEASNKTLEKMYDNQIHQDCFLASAIFATMQQNNHLLKIIKQEKEG